MVKNKALPTNKSNTKGTSIPAIGIVKNITSLKKSDIGLKASSICWSNPFSWANVTIGITKNSTDRILFFMFLRIFEFK